jgi:hypothetical protein
MFEAKNNDPCLVFHGSEEVLRPTPTLYMSWLLWQRNSKNIKYYIFAALKELCQVQPMSRAFECGFNDFAQKGFKFQRDHPDVLTRGQKIGLQYFDDFQKRIPREEILGPVLLTFFGCHHGFD